MGSAPYPGSVARGGPAPRSAPSRPRTCAASCGRLIHYVQMSVNRTRLGNSLCPLFSSVASFLPLKGVRDLREELAVLLFEAVEIRELAVVAVPEKGDRLPVE